MKQLPELAKSQREPLADVQAPELDDTEHMTIEGSIEESLIRICQGSPELADAYRAALAESTFKEPVEA